MSFDPLPEDDESDPPNTPPEEIIDDSPGSPDPAPETNEPEDVPLDVAPVAGVTPTTPPAEPEGPTRATIEFMDRNFGTTYKDKYASDVDFHTARVHLETRLAQRDEDAVYGRQVRAHETEFQAYMAARETGQQPGQPQQPQQQPARQPVSFDQLQSWGNEIKLARANGQEPNAETVRRYNEEAEASNRRSYEMGLQQQPQVTPEQVQQQVDQQVQQRMAEQRQHQTAEQQQHAYVNRVGEQNAHWMYVEGDTAKGLTQQGQRFYSLAKQQTDQNVPMAQAVNNALAAVMPTLTQQQAQPVLGVTPQATHQPNTATAPVGALTDEQMQAKFLKESPDDWATGMGRFWDWKQKQPQ